MHVRDNVNKFHNEMVQKFIHINKSQLREDFFCYVYECRGKFLFMVLIYDNIICDCSVYGALVKGTFKKCRYETKRKIDDRNVM